MILTLDRGQNRHVSCIGVARVASLGDKKGCYEGKEGEKGVTRTSRAKKGVELEG